MQKYGNEKEQTPRGGLFLASLRRQGSGCPFKKFGLFVQKVRSNARSRQRLTPGSLLSQLRVAEGCFRILWSMPPSEMVSQKWSVRNGQSEMGASFVEGIPVLGGPIPSLTQTQMETRALLRSDTPCVPWTPSEQDMDRLKLWLSQYIPLWPFDPRPTSRKSCRKSNADPAMVRGESARPTD